MATQRTKTLDASRVKALREQIDRDPFNVGLRLSLGVLYLGAGHAKDALGVFAQAVEKSRRNWGVSQVNYALALERNGRFDNAVQALDMAIQVDPANAAFYVANKASLYERHGEAAKAKGLYQQILSQPDISKETRRVVLKRAGEK